MRQLFISHVEEDKSLAVEICDALEQRGFTAWYFERDSVPGPPYLKQVVKAIAECEGVVLIVSPISIDSHQVDAEVYRAFETKKRFVPVLRDLSHDEFEEHKPDWTMAMRAATSIQVPRSGLAPILDQLERGVKMLGVSPAAPEPRLGGEKVVRPKSDAVVCTVFAPRECPPGDMSLLQVVMHTPEQEEEAARLARESDPAALPRGAVEVDESLPRGESVRLQFTAKDVEVYEPSAEVIWDGSPQAVQFVAHIPEESRSAKRTALATLLLFRESIPVAHLKFVLRIKETAANVTNSTSAVAKQFQSFRRAYLCYSSEDRVEVLRRAQMLSSMGVSVFMDALNLEPGQDWRDGIRRVIEQSDVFFLFWSEAASRSAEVLSEVEYALHLKGGDPDKPPHIIPIALSLPMPPPPPELASLHFLDTLAYFVAPEASPGKK